ncbi:hypothetical protein L1987_13400 [Smallanthus sonchifolius]|uniref:Uncharacterized protein n=2 Tax=Smallanthus sonchifolius TaxID=185202 RepID=A0ACB9JH95_9ASTR|nr:hypothetical protein L1987_13292 [Smallanthus sonchifolius]KAI3819559.1 hypothetical protein L1987_13400 [Smallanthus sonchifolius]
MSSRILTDSQKGHASLSRKWTPLFDKMYTVERLSARESGRREEDRRRQRQERFPTPDPHSITEEEAEEDALAQESLKAHARSPPPTQPTSGSHLEKTYTQEDFW